jgi:hypothetical protein
MSEESTAVVSWEERLAAMAQESVAAESSVSAGKFLSTKSGVLSYDGNPCPGNQLDVVVIDSVIENQYYEDDYNPDSHSSPVCFSFGKDADTMVPHEKSLKPQHSSCKGCPNNEFGSASRGRGKACGNVRRLALIGGADLSPEAILKAEPGFLKVPVTSVKGWATYVRTLDALHHIPPLGVITTIKVIPDVKSQFKVTFDFKGKIPRESMGAIFQKFDAVAKIIDFPYVASAKEEAPADNGKKKKF